MASQVYIYCVSDALSVFLSCFRSVFLVALKEIEIYLEVNRIKINIEAKCIYRLFFFYKDTSFPTEKIRIGECDEYI